MRTRALRIAKTGVGGMLGAVGDVAVLIGLVEGVGMPPGPAAFFAASIGAVIAFLVSKYWAFRDPSAVDGRQLGAYAAVSLCNAALMAVSVQLFVTEAGLPYLYAKGVSAVMVFAVWSYPAQSRLVFRHAREA